MGVQLTAQQQLSGVQLAKLGPGSLLAENVLGYDADADEVGLAFGDTRRHSYITCHLAVEEMPP